MAEGKVTVIARIKAKTGEVQRVKEELLKLLAPTRAENGCINFDMHQGAADHSQFLFHENWTSEAALEAALRDAAHQELAQAGRGPAGRAARGDALEQGGLRTGQRPAFKRRRPPRRGTPPAPG